MIICSFHLVLICSSVTLFEKPTGRIDTAGITQKCNASSAEEVGYDNSLPGVKLKIPLMNKKIPDVLNRATLLVEHANSRMDVEEEKCKIVFEKKPREVRTSQDYPLLLRNFNESVVLGVSPCWVVLASDSSGGCFHTIMRSQNLEENSLKELLLDPYPSDFQLQHSRTVHPDFEFSKKHKVQLQTALVDCGDNFKLTEEDNRTCFSFHYLNHQVDDECQSTGLGGVEYTWDISQNNTRNLLVNSSSRCADQIQHDQRLLLSGKSKEDCMVCSGDSGGGLISDGRLVYLASGVVRHDDSETCTIGFFKFPPSGVRKKIFPHIHLVKSYIGSINSTQHPATSKGNNDDYDNDDDGGEYDTDNFDTNIQTSKTLILTSSLILLFKSDY